MIDRSRVGFETPPTRVPIDTWRVKLFCEAVGEDDPVYWDPAAAASAGLAACPLPPTYLKAIEGEHFSSAALLQLLQVPLLGVLHAEQQFDYLAPVHVGDTVDLQRRIDRIFDKKDGALSFIVVDTDYRVTGRAVARTQHPDHPRAQPHRIMSWPAELKMQVAAVTPLQLALFGAASGDHNPLHLDPDVARRAGFDKPVVHGMLSMALAGRLFTREFGPQALLRLHARFVGVALVGDAIELTAALRSAIDSEAHYSLRAATERSEVLIGEAQLNRQR